MPARSTSQEDYVLRLIRQAAEMVRRLRERLAGGAAEGEIAAAARAAQGELLGPQAALLGAVDATTALALVGDARRVRLWADLLRVEAAAYRTAGDAPSAARLDDRAARLDAACDAAGAER